MPEKTLQEVSRLINATPDRLRYWVNLLDIDVQKTGRSVTITDETVGLLQTMARLVSEGFGPAEAAKRARGEVSAVPVTIPVNLPQADPAIREELADLRRAVLLLVDENRAMRQELSRIRQRETPEGAFRGFYASFFRPVPKLLETAKDRYEFQPLMISGPSSYVIEDHTVSS